MKEIQGYSLFGYLGSVEDNYCDFLSPIFKKGESFYIQDINIKNGEINYFKISSKLEDKIVEECSFTYLNNANKSYAIYLFMYNDVIYCGNREPISAKMIDIYLKFDDRIDIFMIYEMLNFIGFSALAERERQKIIRNYNINIPKNIIRYSPNKSKNILIETILRTLINHVDKVKTPYENLIGDIIYEKNDYIELGNIQIKKEEFFERYINNDDLINNLNSKKGIQLCINLAKELGAKNYIDFFTKLKNSKILDDFQSEKSLDLSFYIRLLKEDDFNPSEDEAIVFDKLSDQYASNQKKSSLIELAYFENNRIKILENSNGLCIDPKELEKLDQNKKEIEKLHLS